MTDSEVDFYNDVIKQFIAEKMAALTPLERRQLESEARSIILHHKQAHPLFQMSTEGLIELAIKKPCTTINSMNHQCGLR